MKASSTSAGAIVLAVRQLQVLVRDLHRGARFADGLEIGALAQARAGAVLVPLVVDQPGRRHQVEHRGHDVAREPGRGTLAIFGKAALILRPQPVDHEGKRPAAALGLLRAPAAATSSRPRRRRATTTATARRNRTRPACSAAGPGPSAEGAEQRPPPGTPSTSSAENDSNRKHGSPLETHARLWKPLRQRAAEPSRQMEHFKNKIKAPRTGAFCRPPMRKIGYGPAALQAGL